MGLLRRESRVAVLPPSSGAARQHLQQVQYCKSYIKRPHCTVVRFWLFPESREWRGLLSPEFQTVARQSQQSFRGWKLPYKLAAVVLVLLELLQRTNVVHDSVVAGKGAQTPTTSSILLSSAI